MTERKVNFNKMKNINLTVSPWLDYELLDSGGNRKLERYGEFIIARPETQAIWKISRPELWEQVVAEFGWKEGKGAWRKKKNAAESWRLSWNDIRFAVRLTSFKHTGVFPEQEANWEWVRDGIKGIKELGNSQPKILNLFGYTGISSIVAASAGLRRAEGGAMVTHVDASKQSNEWAKENARLSEVPNSGIRFLLDDALKFAEREVRRGAVYEGIILDPPAFGRGPKGEVWRIEEHLPRLLDALEKLLSKKSGSFFLLNGYAAGYSPRSFLQAVESSFDLGHVQGEFGDLSLKESGAERIVPQGIYVRFVK
jgi:23S rRNA (cytosine1962-C5)-methyltransferase